jgi:Caspase domain
MSAPLGLWLAILCAFPIQAQHNQRGLVTPPPQAEKVPQGIYYALVIGINQYQHLPILQTAAEDATAVEAALRQRYGFQTTLLLDAQATRAGIMDALSHYRQALTENDSLLIYYAGHGQYDKEADKAYWLPVNASLTSPAYWISADDITTDVRVLPARHVLIVSDSCFSGGLTRAAGADLRPGQYATYLQKMMNGKSRTLLSSGGNEPVADTGRGGHSVFANAFLNGLLGMASKPFSAAALFDSYIVVPVAGSSQQVPEYNVIRNSGHEAGDFVFIPGAAPTIASGAAAPPAKPEISVGNPIERQVPDVLAIRARESLRDRGLALDVGSVKNALVSVDVDVLNLLSAAAIKPSMIEEALRQRADEKTSVARRFFENSTDSPEAVAWFKRALARGVDPNLTVPVDYYERQGVLLEAMRAGNWNAVRALLDAGASPHAYQNLFLTRYPVTRFLFPIQYIADDDRLSLKEKQDLVKAFLAAGAVVPRLIHPPSADSWTSVMYAAKTLQEQTARKLGMPLPPTPTLCEQPVTPICKRASLRTGDDWCALVKAVPKKLTFLNRGQVSPLYDVTLMYLLSIQQNRMYFLGATRDIYVRYVLAEVSKDASSWTVLNLISPEAGMGLCKKDTDGYQAEECWRRIPLDRVAGTDKMRFEDWGLSWRVSADDCSSPPSK